MFLPGSWELWVPNTPNVEQEGLSSDRKGLVHTGPSGRVLKSHFLVWIVSTFKGQVLSVAGGGHFPSQVSLCLCISSHPVGLPQALFSFLPAPTSVTDPTSFPLLSAISLDARYQVFLPMDTGRPWARQFWFLVNDTCWPSDRSHSVSHHTCARLHTTAP